MSPSRNAKPAAVVGLDIGSDLIKVAEAKCGKDGITITGLGVAPIPEGLIENEVIIDPKGLGDVIKSLLAESGIKTKKVVSSVAGQSRVVVRVIEVPKMSGKELAETMKWEVERHVPFPPNEVVMDYQPLEKPNADPDAQNMEVLLAVAQQELITNHIEAIRAAGLKPMAIDIEPLAASRSLVDAVMDSSTSGVIAIVNIGCNNTDLSIFEDGVLTFPSPPLGIAGINFTREISEAMGQSLEQAEITKKEYAAVDLDGFNMGAMNDLSSFGLGAPAAPAASSEPTSFGTVVGPESDTGLDMADESAAPVQNAFAVPESGQTNSFTTTVDGPVFDMDPLASLGGAAEPSVEAAPVFDFNQVEEESQSAPNATAFDFGNADSGFNIGSEEVVDPVAPMFDLEDDEPAPSMEMDAVSPSFDLSDTKDAADPGSHFEYNDPTPVGVQPIASANPTADTEQKVFQAISGVLMDLATELRRSLEYYSTKYSKTPQRIYLCGGTVKIPNLDKFLSNELGIPVEVADPVKTLNVNVPAASPQYLKEISPLFSVSIGLAIRDMVG